MIYYVVIDTNVLVSAMLKWNSIPGSVMELVFEGPVIPVISKQIIQEYREVLGRPKFHLPENLIRDVIESIEEKGIWCDAEKLNIDLPDPKDQVFYEVVMEQRKSEDAYLVTGNMKHFPQKPFVVTPRELLDIILKEGSDL